jgi:aminocarboxymuconate-semialdehyde decarboxylase
LEAIAMQPVDSHFHWFPRSHFDAVAARTAVPRTERDGDGYRYYYDQAGRYLPLPGEWFDLEAGLAESARVTGADTTVVCTAGVLSGLMDMLPSPDAIDLANEYNEEMAKAQAGYPGRVHGTAYIPLVDVGVALDLAEHAITKLGLKGINLPAITGGETIDAARLDPFYARVEELGVPLIIHPTDFVFAEILDGYGDALQRTVGRLFDSSVTVLRLIFSGVLDRFPDLKILQTHAGGLNPYQAGRIDKNARIASLHHSPSHYLKRLYVDTVAPQDLTIRTAVEFFGADRVLYGTDYPCWAPAAARQVIEDCGFVGNVEHQIMSANARAVFGL